MFAGRPRVVQGLKVELHSTPKDYPFKLKAAFASPAVSDGCAIPVFCGLAIGADAPKIVRGYVILDVVVLSLEQSAFFPP